jgi:hypothetical protein
MHEILQRSWCQRYGQRDSTEDNNCKAYLAQNAAQSCIVERILTRPEAQYKTTGTRKPSSVRFLRQGAVMPLYCAPSNAESLDSARYAPWTKRDDTPRESV